MKIAILSNINVSSLALRFRQEPEVYSSLGYDSWLQDLVNSQSPFYSQDIADCFIILSSFGSLDREAAYNILSDTVQKKKDCNFYISTIDSYGGGMQVLKNKQEAYSAEDDWFYKVSLLIKSNKNVFLLDMRELYAAYGFHQMLSKKMWYLSSNPFSVFGEKRIQELIHNILSAKNKARKKCLLVDLDNTLWGGVVGEDGLENLVLSSTKEGSRYKKFQYKIK